MSLKASEKKSLRRIAHHLDSVVIVGEQGVSEGVIAETQRALKDHELIKVKFAMGERNDRQAAAATLAEACEAELVQQIGKVAVLYKPNAKADPKLSNIARFAY